MSGNTSKKRMTTPTVDIRTKRFSMVGKKIQRTPDFSDPEPALVEGGRVMIGNMHHAANIDYLVENGVTAVLNCASGGISRLPVDELKERGIRYAFTNVRQDSYTYPILHDDEGNPSKHLQIAKLLYDDVRKGGGKVLFFCVAGQNRSAALAAAVLMLFGHSLDDILRFCARARPFVLENVGFQRQLLELESILAEERRKRQKIVENSEGDMVYLHGNLVPEPATVRSKSETERMSKLVEIELLIPGLCTMDVKIPMPSSIETVKKCLIDYANDQFLSHSSPPVVVAKSWVVLAHFGYDPMYDFPLEEEAIERKVQYERIKKMYDLKITTDGAETVVGWTERCRFALVIYSVNKNLPDGTTLQEPWTFVHEERPGVPATYLESSLLSTHLRAWDFCSGQAFASETPVVFTFSDDARDRRPFMRISTSANEPQQFQAPGEGGVLGMGANAVVHRVMLRPTSDDGGSKLDSDDSSLELLSESGWDAAVKRPFSLSKMLQSLEKSSEAGLAKRIRLANSLNSDGRVLYFYGLGVAVSSDAYNQDVFKFEAVLLAKYEEEFSTYTMRRFMEEYIAIPSQVSPAARLEIEKLQGKFSIIKVKRFLVSLLNGFRDLTLMGVQAFDFNHMNNVLVSRDHQRVHIIDIDGNSKGSIQFPSDYISGVDSFNEGAQASLHKPSLEIDLNTVLPKAVTHLILGKGRGPSFITNTASQIWRAEHNAAKDIIKKVLHENFFSDLQGDEDVAKADEHCGKIAEWFYAVIKKSSPWDRWTNDIYDAMRCIDHLPVF